MKYKNYDEIYPLTIVQMRYGGKYVAFNVDVDCETVHDVQLSEEAMYNTKSFIEKKYFGSYGIADTLWGALDNLILNHNKDV